MCRLESLTSSGKGKQEFEVRFLCRLVNDFFGGQDIHRDWLLTHDMLSTLNPEMSSTIPTYRFLSLSTGQSASSR